MTARKTLAQLAADSADAQRAVREIREEMRALDRAEVVACLKRRRDSMQAQVARLQQRLDRLSARELTPEVEADLAMATVRLERLQLRLDGLTR